MAMARPSSPVSAKRTSAKPAALSATPSTVRMAESSSMATYALANIVSASDKPLSELIAPLKKYAQSGEINTRTTTPPAEILAKIKADYAAKARVFELDGVSVDAWDTEGYWANVRMSNTEPLVRLNLEGKTKEIMEAKRDEFLAIIRS